MRELTQDDRESESYKIGYKIGAVQGTAIKWAICIALSPLFLVIMTLAALIGLVRHGFRKMGSWCSIGTLANWFKEGSRATARWNVRASLDHLVYLADRDMYSDAKVRGQCASLGTEIKVLASIQDDWRGVTHAIVKEIAPKASTHRGRLIIHVVRDSIGKM